MSAANGMAGTTSAMPIWQDLAPTHFFARADEPKAPQQFAVRTLTVAAYHLLVPTQKKRQRRHRRRQKGAGG